MAPDSSTQYSEVAQTVPDELPGVAIGLLTGCQDRHYAFGLATALAATNLRVEIVGGDQEDSPEFHNESNLHFLNFCSGQKERASFSQKLAKVLLYYAKLIRYAARPTPAILHILWNYKFPLFDRTVLMFFYKLCGKKVVLTAHNVNQARRDLNDSWINRATLKIQYKLCSHIFVHSQKMKDELCADFEVAEGAVTVIPYPINNATPDTGLTPGEAKSRLGISEDEKTILFFGRLVPYKGLEDLIDAFRLLATNTSAKYRLIIAGEPKKGSEEYLSEIEASLQNTFDKGQVMLRMQFVPDSDMELYFKGADVLALPYKDIFQSGVLFLGYSFGLPAVATDVGSFREDIVDGKTGFLCQQGDAKELANAFEKYFSSDLYADLKLRRPEIKQRITALHSWQTVAELTCQAYAKALKS